MNICMLVGVDDSVRVVLDAVKRFAAPDKLPPREIADNLRRYGDIDVFFDMREGHEGEANFFFITYDNLTVNFTVDFKSLDRDLIDQLSFSIEEAINIRRKTRITGSTFHPAPRATQ